MNGRNFGAEGFLPLDLVEAFSNLGNAALAQIAVGEDPKDKPNEGQSIEDQYPGCAFV